MVGIPQSQMVHPGGRRFARRRGLAKRADDPRARHGGRPGQARPPGRDRRGKRPCRDPFRVEIGSQITGTVSEVLVERARRQRGQPLVAWIERTESRSWCRPQSAVAQAEARLRQLRELTLPPPQRGPEPGSGDARQRAEAYESTEQLVQSGFWHARASMTPRRDLDVARTQVRTAELQVFTHSPGGSDYVMAQTALNQAQANSRPPNPAWLRDIAAPRDGTLISRNVERGDVVQPGKALMVLSPAGIRSWSCRSTRRTWAARVGQKALASADAYPDQRFDARSSTSIPASTFPARLGRGEAHRRNPAGLSAPGHDGLGRHRGRSNGRRAGRAGCASCTTPSPAHPGCWSSRDGRPRGSRSGSACAARPASRSWTGLRTGDRRDSRRPPASGRGQRVRPVAP